MDIYEFQLRHIAYAGLARLLSIDRDDQTIMELTKISPLGKPDKVIQELSPAELKQLTKHTYTIYKQKIVSDSLALYCIPETPKYSLSDYIERLEYEMKVIKEMGFHTYMLVVSDYTTRAKNNQIMVGTGRGSGAGSLLARCMNITDINPFLYDLLFERFLNPARVSMPDFDIDFEDTLRDKVVNYVTEKYGRDKVSSIGTYMKLATKAAFKDVARAMGIPFDKANIVVGLMDEDMSLKDMTVDNTAINEDMRNMLTNDTVVAKAIEQAGQIEGSLRQMGVHACGVIIAPNPITDYTPVQIVKKGKETLMVSQYDGPTLEYIGLLKMDFLGLRNLSVIKQCIKIIGKRSSTRNETDEKLFGHFWKTMSFNPPLDDEFVYSKVFMTGDTTGIFQFEGEGIRKYLIDLKPNGINDLLAMNALYRPGPLEFIPTYINRKHGLEPVEYMLPELRETLAKLYDEDVIADERQKLIEDLDPIMGITYGIAVYQEQLMFLVQSMAGFSLPEADLLRRGVGKKKKDIIEKLKIEFTARAGVYRNYKPETAVIIYEKMIEPAASYSFNKSHAACYAHIAYQTAYLKAHYPIEFYASLMRSVQDDTEKLATAIQESREHGIPVSAPAINTAYTHIAAIENTIVLGFLSIKGIGEEAAEYIQNNRQTLGTFGSLEDFVTRCASIINKRTWEALAKAGALDEYASRTTLLAHTETILEWIKSLTSNAGQESLFGGTDTIGLQLTNILPASTLQICQYDFEIYKTYITAHPLDGLYSYAKKYGFLDQVAGSVDATPFGCLALVMSYQRAKKKGFFVRIVDMTGDCEIFLKDMMDIRPWDILHISGYKSRQSYSIDKAIRIGYDELIAKVKSKGLYDPTRTIAKVRKERGKKPVILKPKPVKPIEHVKSVHEPIDIPPTIQPSENTLLSPSHPLASDTHTISQKLDMKTLMSLGQLIKNNPGDINIYIGTKHYIVSQTGWEKIQGMVG